MRKSILIGGLMACSLSGLVLAATQFGAANSNSHQAALFAKTKMADLAKHANDKKQGIIPLGQFFFIAGKPERTESIVRSFKERKRLLGPEYLRLKERCNWLCSQIQVMEGEANDGTGTITMTGNKKPIADCVIFGVEAVKIPQVNGNFKYLAIRPEIIGSIETFASIESRIPNRNLRTYSRNDFVNPDDIDWFFGVKDFSTYRHN